MDPAELTLVDARRAIGAGELSPVELLDAVLDRVRARNDELRAYLLVDENGARAAARAAEAAARDGDARPLLGIPLCIKDVIDVAGLPTTAGGKGWRREPSEDAVAVARLRAAGAVFVGKGNTNEFAYGIDGRNPHWGDVPNPLDTKLLCGGSSSGPAAATATGMALAGLGTDTTGSLRVPASLCGLVALRPTLGTPPTRGVVALSWSYDTVGPIARTVEDAAVLWSVLAGDETVHRDARLPRVGVLDQLMAGTAAPVAEGVRRVAVALDAEQVELTELRHTEALHTIVLACEASADHDPWFAEQRERYSQVVRERIELGRTIPGHRLAARPAGPAAVRGGVRADDGGRGTCSGAGAHDARRRFGAGRGRGRPAGGAACRGAPAQPDGRAGHLGAGRHRRRRPALRDPAGGAGGG